MSHFDYRVDDRLWRRVAPDALRLGVICLPCLDHLAGALGEDVSAHLEQVQWCGVGKTVVLQPEWVHRYAAKQPAAPERAPEARDPWTTPHDAVEQRRRSEQRAEYAELAAWRNAAPEAREALTMAEAGTCPACGWDTAMREGDRYWCYRPACGWFAKPEAALLSERPDAPGGEREPDAWLLEHRRPQDGSWRPVAAGVLPYEIPPREPYRAVPLYRALRLAAPPEAP